MADPRFYKLMFVTPLRGKDALNMLTKFVPKGLTDKLREVWGARLGDLGFNDMFSVGVADGNEWHIGLDGKEGYYSLLVMNATPMTIRKAKEIEAAALKRAGAYTKDWLWVTPADCRDRAFMQKVYTNIAAKKHWADGI